MFRRSLAVLLVVGCASAQVDSYGHVITDMSGTFQNPLLSGGPDLVGYLATGSSFSGSEALFLARQQTLAAGDIALNDATGLQPGTPLPGSHHLVGAQLTPISGPVAIFDGNGDGRFGSEDFAVLDQNGAGSGQVSIHDVVLSGERAGEAVGPSTTGLNAPVTSMQSPPFLYLDLDADGVFGTGDGVYIDMDRDSHATITDVRMTAHNGLVFGQVLHLSSPDRAFLLRTEDAPEQFSFLDEDGNGVFNAGDVAYLEAAGGAVRLVPSDHGPAGSHVTGSASDANAPRQVLSGNLVEVGDGDGRIQEQEVLAFDIAGGQGALDGFDIILSGSDAGKPAHETPHAGAAIAANVFGTGYLDLDGDRLFSVGDIPYYNGDGDGFVSVGDVQLAQGPPGAPTSTQTQTGTGTETDHPTGTTSGTADRPSTTDASTHDDGEAVPAAAWAVGALLLVALLRRY